MHIQAHYVYYLRGKVRVRGLRKSAHLVGLQVSLPQNLVNGVASYPGSLSQSAHAPVSLALGFPRTSCLDDPQPVGIRILPGLTRTGLVF